MGSIDSLWGLGIVAGLSGIIALGIRLARKIMARLASSARRPGPPS